MKPSIRNVVIGIVAFIVLVAVIFSFFNAGTDSTNLSFSEVIDAGRDNQLERIEVRGDNLDITLRGDSTLYESKFAEGGDVTQTLIAAGVAVGGADGAQIEYKSPSSYGNLINLVFWCLQLLVFPFVLYFSVKWGVREALRLRGGSIGRNSGN